MITVYLAVAVKHDAFFSFTTIPAVAVGGGIKQRWDANALATE